MESLSRDIDMINMSDGRSSFDIIDHEAAERAPVTQSDGANTWEQFMALRRLVNGTAERIWRFSDLHPHIEALEDMIFTLDDGGLMSQMFLSGLSPAQVALQQVAYCQWETELERRFVHGRSSPRHLDEYALAPRFRRLVEREVELLVSAGRPDRLLFVGSGPLPISAILAQEYLSAAVDCVDLDWMAVADSRALLQDLGLADRLEVFHADGARFDASRYDGILIALLAKPKSEILAAIARTARPDCRIVCRTSHGLRHLLYEPMSLSRDLRAYEVRGERRASRHGDTISSLLLGPAGS